MGKVEQRIKRLEGATGGEARMPLVCVAFMAPGPDGPVDEGISIIAVPSNGQFCRCDYPSDEAFKAAVDEAHVELHGIPVSWSGDEKFYVRDGGKRR